MKVEVVMVMAPKIAPPPDATGDGSETAAEAGITGSSDGPVTEQSSNDEEVTEPASATAPPILMDSADAEQ